MFPHRICYLNGPNLHSKLDGNPASVVLILLRSLCQISGALRSCWRVLISLLQPFAQGGRARHWLKWLLGLPAVRQSSHINEITDKERVFRITPSLQPRCDWSSPETVARSNLLTSVPSVSPSSAFRFGAVRFSHYCHTHTHTNEIP